MPTYDYVCEACRNEFEHFQSIKDEPLRKCPACGKKKLRRLIGPGAGIVFKGSGFYQTDYRSESYKKSAAAEKTNATAGSSNAASGEAGKNAGKTEAKADAKPKDQKAVAP